MQEFSGTKQVKVRIREAFQLVVRCAEQNGELEGAIISITEDYFKLAAHFIQGSTFSSFSSAPDWHYKK